MCKLMGYRYAPDKEAYWKQGYSSEKSFIFTTTARLTETTVGYLSDLMGEENLLICCSSYLGNKDAFKNIQIKRIPQAVLKKCEFGKAGYPLPVREDFNDDDFEFAEE